MKLLPWLLAAIAIGVASFLVVENRETARKLDALLQRLEEARQAAIALGKARDAERQVRRAADLAQQRALAEARVKAEIAARNAQRAADAAREQALAAEKRKREAESAREAALREELEAQKRALEAERVRLVAERERAERAVAEAKAAAERARQPKAPTIITSDEARKKAMDLEAQGRGQEAVRIYVTAARAGNCEAAARLGKIYDKGLAGVARNYAESLKWYNAARVLGCDVALSPRS